MVTRRIEIFASLTETTNGRRILNRPCDAPTLWMVRSPAAKTCDVGGRDVPVPAVQLLLKSSQHVKAGQPSQNAQNDRFIGGPAATPPRSDHSDSRGGDGPARRVRKRLEDEREPIGTLIVRRCRGAAQARVGKVSRDIPVTLQGAHELQIQCSDLTLVQRELRRSAATSLQEFRIHVLPWLQVFEGNRVVVTRR